jgi:preprotein translocase subunit SecG
MENVVLIVHLILAIFLIAVVLLQRSEGGALGIGGGGGGLVSARGAATALSKVTWMLAAGFICTSIALTVLAGGGGPSSVFDGAGPADPASIPLPALPGGGSGIPAPGTEAPLPQGDGGASGAAQGGDGDVPLPAAPAPAQ